MPPRPTTPVTFSSGPSRRSALALLAAAPAVALAGCGAAPSTPTADRTARRAATVRIGAVAAGGPAAVDPHGTLFNESDWLRHAAVYDSLVGAGPDGPIPALAERWDADASARTWTFTLRSDAVFSNGRPVTSADVLYSVRRLAELAARNAGRLGTVDAARSSAPKRTTVVLTTTTPDADLPRTLAGVVFVVPDGTTNFTEPVGSGPYRLTASSAQGITLAAAPNWWGGRPVTETLEIRGFADPDAMTAAVTGGAIDVAIGVAPAAATAAAGRPDLQVVKQPRASTAPLLMRLDAEPFDRVEVRRAIRVAVDRPALVRAVYLGYGEVGSDLPQPSDPSAPKLTAPPRDVAQARELLAAAGHPRGLDVTLHTTTAYPAMAASATVVARQLAEAGIRVEVTSHPPATYWTQVYTKVPFSVGYYAQVPYPTWVRQTALAAAAFNETGWRRADFDAAFATAMSTLDTARRNAELGRLQQQMATDGGIVAWGHGDALTVARRGVTGVPTGPGFARLRLTDLALDT